MTIKHKLIDASLITAAALSLATIPMSSSLAAADKTEVKCYGANGCKSGHGCGKNGCPSPSAGYKMMASEKACKDAGGSTTDPKQKSDNDNQND